jgi:hypothetical protein
MGRKHQFAERDRSAAVGQKTPFSPIQLFSRKRTLDVGSFLRADAAGSRATLLNELFWELLLSQIPPWPGEMRLTLMENAGLEV